MSDGRSAAVGVESGRETFAAEDGHGRLLAAEGGSPLDAGLYVLPMAGMTFVFAPLSGRLTGARGPRLPLLLSCCPPPTPPPAPSGSPVTSSPNSPPRSTSTASPSSWRPAPASPSSPTTP
ncbi:hypothetical protein ACWCQ0_47030, partial [Streptomyces massasporeus]